MPSTVTPAGPAVTVPKAQSTTPEESTSGVMEHPESPLAMHRTVSSRLSRRSAPLTEKSQSGRVSSVSPTDWAERSDEADEPVRDGSVPTTGASHQVKCQIPQLTGGDVVRRKGLRDFTKGTTLPPFNLSASIGGVTGLERVVKRMEIQLRGLEIQFERFKRAHVELRNDYDNLQEYCDQVEGVQRKESCSGSNGDGEGTESNEESPKDDGNGDGSSGNSTSSSRVMRRRPFHRRARSAPRAQPRSVTSGSMSSGPGSLIRASSHPRPSTGQVAAGLIPQQGSPRNLSSKSIVRRRPSSMPSPRGNSNRQGILGSRPNGRQSDVSESSSLDRSSQLKPRVLPKRMTTNSVPSRDLLQTSELGTTYAAFPPWSKLGNLGKLGTFQSTQGASVVRKWKKGKPPMVAV